MTAKPEILSLILKAIEEYNLSASRKLDLKQGSSLKLYGSEGALDSLGLVTLIVAIEQALQDQLGIEVALADDRAMSQTRSPYRSVQSLVDYIEMLMAEPKR